MLEYSLCELMLEMHHYLIIWTSAQAQNFWVILFTGFSNLYKHKHNEKKNNKSMYFCTLFPNPTK